MVIGVLLTMIIVPAQQQHILIVMVIFNTPLVTKVMNTKITREEAHCVQKSYVYAPSTNQK